jgi:hypothetical protein
MERSAAVGAAKSVVLRLRVSSKAYTRLCKLGASERQAAQEFLAVSLQDYFDRIFPAPGGPNLSLANCLQKKADFRKISLTEIESVVPAAAGIYEIHTLTGIPLKVGIGKNLRKRLLQHRASRQSALKLKAGGQRRNPSDVRSKGSILAKHLYYDTSLAAEYDLTSEAGRRLFLKERCYFIFEQTTSGAEARKLEEIRERQVRFRYIGNVSKR